MPKKVFDDDFKREAIKLAEQSAIVGKSIASVAKDLGINSRNLYHWVNKASKDENGVIVTDSEMTKLRKELAEVKLERDILKKAVAIFSRQQK